MKHSQTSFGEKGDFKKLFLIYSFCPIVILYLYIFVEGFIAFGNKFEGFLTLFVIILYSIILIPAFMVIALAYYSICQYLKMNSLFNTLLIGVFIVVIFVCFDYYFEQSSINKFEYPDVLLLKKQLILSRISAIILSYAVAYYIWLCYKIENLKL